MEKLFFQTGDVIIYDGLYGCAADSCEEQAWGIAGRRLGRLPCGHLADWRLIRRRVDHLL